MDNALSKDERLWGMLCHLSSFAFFIFPFGNVIGPLIIWMIKKEEYPFVDEQGKESLNFQISVSIYAIICAFLIIVLIGIALLIGLFLVSFILVVIASIKANDGQSYKYPFTINLIK